MWRLGLLMGVLLATLPLHAMAEATGLQDLQGTHRTLGDYTGKGQWTVVMVWASTCGVCQHEAPRMEAFYQKHKDNQARVLGVSVDGRDSLDAARHFVAGHALSFPNLVGDGEDVATLFFDMTGTSLLGTPAFLVFDPAGTLRTYQIGPVDALALEKFIQQPYQLTALEVVK